MYKLVILALLAVPSIYAMESPEDHAASEAIKPCAKEECAQLRAQFEKQQCDKACRNKYLYQLAGNFDIKKDGQFLRALICADKLDNAYCDERNCMPIFSHLKDLNLWHERHWNGGVGHARERNFWCTQGFSCDYYESICGYSINFINRAVANNNMQFMKIFFKLFEINANDTGVQSSKGTTLAFDGPAAIEASEDMIKLMLDNALMAKARIAERCFETSRPSPGCRYFMAELKKIWKQEKKEQEEKEQKFTQDLRDAIGSAKI
ncbi:hypothetical protein BH09DEP1_BH09DEP1_0650 [soil metagenome]